jgi:hypothetical protein
MERAVALESTSWSKRMNWILFIFLASGPISQPGHYDSYAACEAAAGGAKHLCEEQQMDDRQLTPAIGTPVSASPQ